MKGKNSTETNGDAIAYRGRKLAFEVLNRVLMGGGYSNALMASKFERGNLSTGDKQAATNLVYGVLRNLTLLDEVFRSKSDKGKIELSPPLLTLGRMAIYELLFSQSIPNYASVSEYVKLARGEGSPGEAGFMNACLRKVSKDDRDRLVKRIKDPIERMALRYSHPEWMARDFADLYGVEVARNILRSNNNPQPVYFRINAPRIKVEDILTALEYQQRDFEALGAPPFCLCLPFGKGAFPKKEYESGWLTAQDRSTQFIAFYLNPEPGDRILDLCCGSGIKSGQLMELMGCEGELVAVDIYKHKLESVDAEFRRLGLRGVKTVEADVTKKPKLGQFEKVLFDAPCSGSGTVRHRPEIKYRVKREDIAELTKKQDALFDAASAYVAPGGILAYSTCSLLSAENEDRVGAFLDRHSEFIHITKEVEASLPFSVVHFHRGRWGTTFVPVTVNGCGTFVSVLRRLPG
ncbi:MAG: 16S rRNA (cytosine(967)-C(5))-methyltransferase RsmB [bacterium]